MAVDNYKNESSTQFYKRTFISTSDQLDQQNELKFTLMQWNILAQGFIALDEFVYCPKNLLLFEDRCLRIVEQIDYYQPDLICLQEADIINSIMNKLNNLETKYDHIFLPKTRSPCLIIPNNFGPDGLAIIYRKDKFVLKHYEEIPLDHKNNRKGLMAKFELISSQTNQQQQSQHVNKGENYTIYLICLHLKAKTEFEQFRLSQGNLLMNYLKKLYENDIKNNLKFNNLFICGDFNAEYNESVMDLIRNYDLEKDYNYKLKSSYFEAYKNQEPEFTTWKYRQSERIKTLTEACHTIDYIWYLSLSTKLLGVWSIPTKEEIGPKGLPSIRFPSDHMNLIAQFQL